MYCLPPPRVWFCRLLGGQRLLRCADCCARPVANWLMGQCVCNCPYRLYCLYCCRRYKELEQYILDRRDELTGRKKGGSSGGSGSAAEEPAAAAPKGFA